MNFRLLPRHIDFHAAQVRRIDGLKQRVAF